MALAVHPQFPAAGFPILQAENARDLPDLLTQIDGRTVQVTGRGDVSHPPARLRIGNRAPLNAVRWRIEYRQTDGGTYIAREIALAPLQATRAVLHDATITFGEVKLSSHLAHFWLSFSKNVPIGEP